MASKKMESAPLIEECVSQDNTPEYLSPLPSYLGFDVKKRDSNGLPCPSLASPEEYPTKTGIWVILNEELKLVLGLFIFIVINIMSGIFVSMYIPLSILSVLILFVAFIVWKLKKLQINMSDGYDTVAKLNQIIEENCSESVSVNNIS